MATQLFVRCLFDLTMRRDLCVPSIQAQCASANVAGRFRSGSQFSRCFEGEKRSPGRPISRILCANEHSQNAIRRRSSICAAYPGVSSEQLTPCLALLPAGVAWPRTLPPAPVSSYLTFSPLPPPCPPPNPKNLGKGLGGGGLFLWPDPGNYFPPGFPRHRALWSADFPRAEQSSTRDRPANLGQIHVTTKTQIANIWPPAWAAYRCAGINEQSRR